MKVARRVRRAVRGNGTAATPSPRPGPTQLAALPTLRRPGGDRHGRPDPRRRWPFARTASRRRDRPVGHRLRRLAQGAAARVHRRHRARRAGPVPRLRQRHPRRTTRRGRGPGRLPRRQTRHPGPRRGPPPRPAGHPRPARAPRRPALQDPRAAAPRPGTPDRQATRPPRGRSAGRRPQLGGHDRLVLPTSNCAPPTPPPARPKAARSPSR